MSQSPYPPMPPAESGGGVKIPILFGIVIALMAANVYLYLQIDEIKGELAKSKDKIQTDISNLRETSTISNQTSRRQLESVRADLEAARRRAEAAAGEAKTEALKQVEELENKVAAEDKRQQEQVRTELSKVEQNALAATSQVKETLTSAVTDVKKDVSSTKSELDKTIADLKRVTGDLGVTSGFVATNTKELSALKALGERSYYEFTIVKSKQPIRLSDITILLKSADLKRNRYTIELVADDKKVEKKDKSVNEPVQFYMAKFRQPCEIVVNSIQKDKIVGYLSQPKVVTPRGGAAAPSGE